MSKTSILIKKKQNKTLLVLAVQSMVKVALLAKQNLHTISQYHRSMVLKVWLQHLLFFVGVIK